MGYKRLKIGTVKYKFSVWKSVYHLTRNHEERNVCEAVSAYSLRVLKVCQLACQRLEVLTRFSQLLTVREDKHTL